MDIQAAFLNAILASPEDDAPRLAYADWLEERGDPLGEFIRIDCLLCRQNESDYYDQFTFPTHDRLAVRRTKLLALHRDNWLAPFIGAQLDGLAFEFRRGFVEIVSGTVTAFLTQYAKLFQLPLSRLLTWINLYGDIDAASLSSFAMIPYLARTSVLQFSDCSLPASVLDIMAQSDNLTNLRRLILADYSGVSKNERRESGMLIDHEVIRPLTAPGPFSKLDWLDLHGHSIGDDGMSMLATSRVAQQLRFLDVGDNGLSSDGVRSIGETTAFRSLESLSIESNDVSPSGISDWAALRESMSALRVLNLRFNRLGVRGARRLASILPGMQVKSLYLRGNRIRRPGMEAIVDAIDWKWVWVIDLRDNGICVEAIELLSVIPDETSLRLLDLSDNPIGDEGVRQLTKCAALGRLECLALRKCRLGDAGVAALASSANVRHLISLDLRGNRIGAQGIRSLLSSQYLANVVFLGIDMRGMSSSDGDELRARFGSAVN